MNDVVDVLVVGGGPAGATAATVLARAGAAVRVVDRETFPRQKLCGDTLNPGAMRDLHRLGLADGVEAHGLPIEGVLITGAGGVTIDEPYPRGLHGRSIQRRDLDWMLMEQAMAAGAVFEPGVRVRRALLDAGRSGARVCGVATDAHDFKASVVIAADGRRSAVVSSLGLARPTRHPRRWVIGAYVEGTRARSSRVEMHVRGRHYVGIVSVPGGLTRVCVVAGADAPWAASGLGKPADVLREILQRDPALRDRFEGCVLAGPIAVLGPLAVEDIAPRIDGLLVAGDAAGFIDPMTGDGLRFAIRGGELAAGAALDALAHGWSGVHESLLGARRREFGAKWRFNRRLRTLAASPAAVRIATAAATFAPSLVRRFADYAGDCHVSLEPA